MSGSLPVPDAVAGRPVLGGALVVSGLYTFARPWTADPHPIPCSVPTYRDAGVEHCPNVATLAVGAPGEEILACYACVSLAIATTLDEIQTRPTATETR